MRMTAEDGSKEEVRQTGNKEEERATRALKLVVSAQVLTEKATIRRRWDIARPIKVQPRQKQFIFYAFEICLSTMALVDDSSLPLSPSSRLSE